MSNRPTRTALVGVVVDPPKAVTIFGREPAALLGLLEALLAAFVVFPLGARLGLDQTFVVLVMAVLSAAVGVYSAIATRDTLLGVVVGLVKALIALAAYFRFELSPDQMAMLVAVTAAAVGFFQRTQTSPVADPVDPSPSQVIPVAPAPDVAQAIEYDGMGAPISDPGSRSGTVRSLVNDALSQPYEGKHAEP